MSQDTFEILVTVLGTAGLVLFGYFGYKIRQFHPLLKVMLEIGAELAKQTPSTSDDELIERLLLLLEETGRIELVGEEVSIDLPVRPPTVNSIEVFPTEYNPNLYPVENTINYTPEEVGEIIGSPTEDTINYEG